MLIVLLAVAHATIVNVLTPSVGVLDDGWHGSVKASVSVLDGNEQRLGLELGAGVTYKRTRHLVSMRASGIYAVARGEKVAQRAFTNVRHRYLFADPFSSVAFAQLDHNPFRGLAVRDLFGGGLDWRFARTKIFEAHLGITLMGEHQVHNEGFLDEDAGLHLRSSNYLTLALKSEKVLFANTTFFQPRVDQPSNWRLLSEVSLTVDLTSHLDWNVLFRVERDSSPPTGVEPTDVSFTSGLVLGF